MKIHYNANNNVLTSKLTISNIKIHSLRSIFYSQVSLHSCKVYGFDEFCKNFKIIIDKCFILRRLFATSVFFKFVLSFHSLDYVISYVEILSDLQFALSLLHTGTSGYLVVLICEVVTVVFHVLL